MIRGLVFFVLISISIQASAGDKIKFYFNHSVDNTVSTGVNAVYLNNCVGDTLAAYINRAKYTIDVAVYHFQTSASNIATAINAAKARGVVIRWIYDGADPSSNNSALPLLDPGINTLGSPQTSNYTIMHNKFMVIDPNSPDPNDAIVWTGSSNWNSQQFKYDYNNYVIIQDAPLAKAYVGQFNMMWGGSGVAPDLSASKFGQYKTDLGQHDFTIDGKHVEVYFSPADGTHSHIYSALQTADKDLYVGMYTFTYSSDASLMVSKYTNGVYVAAIEDVSSQSSSPYSILMSGLTGSNFKVYNGPGSDIYHNKFLIVDPSDKCSDPMVLTGSHNWSVSADTKNDENMLIIHDAAAANIYYQSFRADFASMGGSLTTVLGCATGVPAVSNAANDIAIYPNPANGNFTVAYNLSRADNVTVELFDMTGRKVASALNGTLLESGQHSSEIGTDVPGLYLLKIIAGNETMTRKVTVVR